MRQNQFTLYYGGIMAHVPAKFGHPTQSYQIVISVSDPCLSISILDFELQIPHMLVVNIYIQQNIHLKFGILIYAYLSKYSAI